MFRQVLERAQLSPDGVAALLQSVDPPSAVALLALSEAELLELTGEERSVDRDGKPTLRKCAQTNSPAPRIARSSSRPLQSLQSLQSLHFKKAALPLAERREA